MTDPENLANWLREMTFAGSVNDMHIVSAFVIANEVKQSMNPKCMDCRASLAMTASAAIYIFLLERDSFTGCVLDLTPGFFNIAYDRFGHGHIVQIKRDFVAILVRPGEELERFGRVGGLVL